MILVQETWTTQYCQLCLNGYIYHNYPRKSKDPKAKRASGGIGIFIKSDILNIEIVDISKSDNVVWIKIQNVLFCDDIYVGIVYMPPESSRYAMAKDIFSVLAEDIFSLSVNGHILLCGDFNARTGLLSDFHLNCHGSLGHSSDDLPYFVDHYENITVERVNQDKNVNSYGRDLIDLCKSAGIYIVNGRTGSDKDLGRFTRVDTTGCSVVDYLLCSLKFKSYLVNFKIGDKVPESDHLPIEFDLSINTQDKIKSKLNSRDCYNTETWCRYKINDVGLDEFKQNILNEHTLKLMEKVNEAMIFNDNVNIVSSLYSKILLDAADKSFAKYKTGVLKKTGAQPIWFDNECKIARKRAICAYKENDKYNAEAIQCRNQYRALKQKKIRAFRKSLHEKIDNCNDGKQQSMWYILNPYLNRKTSIGLMNEEFYDAFSILADNQAEISDLDYENSVKLFLSNYDNGNLDELCTDSNINAVLNSNITFQELNSVIVKLQNKKSPGIDAITPELTKHCPDSIIHQLVTLFNYILEKREYPDNWVMGTRIPVPKIHNPKSVDNYRQVTILPLFTKLFESILCNRLTFINEAYSKVDLNNGGFLKGSQTSDNALILLGCIQSQLYKQEIVFKKDKATLHVTSKICENTVNYYN